MPGDFQSVDLAGVYGEPFVHTSYLRWSVVLLVVAAGFAHRRLRPWLGLGLAACVLGLGPYLWWGGDWLLVGGNMLSLPFAWLLALLPEVAITHPLRLSLGAQALFCALSAVGLAVVFDRVPARLHKAGFAIVALLVTGEALFGSAATWPLPTSDASIPSVYEDAPEGMVLDLPAEVGTSMDTSRYFWFQTEHGRPIPYTPDVRMGSARDTVTFRTFQRPPRNPMDATLEVPTTPSNEVVLHMKKTYGLVVLHPELEARAGLSPSYRQALSPVLGEPEQVDGVLVWRLR
jgi:hypothetical protein